MVELFCLLNKTTTTCLVWRTHQVWPALTSASFSSLYLCSSISRRSCTRWRMVTTTTPRWRWWSRRCRRRRWCWMESSTTAGSSPSTTCPRTNYACPTRRTPTCRQTQGPRKTRGRGRGKEGGGGDNNRTWLVQAQTKQKNPQFTPPLYLLLLCSVGCVSAASWWKIKHCEEGKSV